MKIAIMIVVGLAIGVNLLAFILEKLMKKRMDKMANENKQ